MTKNIAAHTTAYIGGDHVDFISINYEDDGRVSIAVRENSVHATVHMSKHDWLLMRYKILAEGSWRSLTGERMNKDEWAKLVEQLTPSG